MRVLAAAVCAAAAAAVSGFVVVSPVRMSAEQQQQPVTRRTALVTGAMAIAGAASLGAAPARAAGVPGGDRLVTGYQQLTYLVNNWDKETTACDANGKCERKPDNVRRYLGLRSTTDPLFQIERVLEKAQAYIEDPDDAERYIDAAETFQSTQSMANSMAFTSSFGEYNPGGGKDQVEKYLEESRKQVVMCQKALGDIVEILKLQ